MPYIASFGSEWWTRRWIAALEALGWENRLERGRTYARTGRVLSLNIEPGLAEARVRGSRPVPYRVVIRLDAFSRGAWLRVMDLIAQKARYAGQLLAGEMPEDVDELFEEAGHSLFPTHSSELRATCSCPDDANPCKHIAAVHYVLGARFDADPFVLFQLRGMPRATLLEELRARRHVSPAGPPAGFEAVPELSRPVALEGYHVPRAELPAARLEMEVPDVEAGAFALALPRALSSDRKLIDGLVKIARAAAAHARELA
ncbi:MAG TPA: SWIM zinc finger family protein [Chloroflexota bacterium]|nr:SWIM zinc finger family protein [Chloroflexota bacterium]